MTIQTDYEEIEKMIKELGEDDLYWRGVKHTFVITNLKRINEMIEFLEKDISVTSKSIKFQIMNGENRGRIVYMKDILIELRFYRYLEKLKADKKFLEEKR